MKFKYNFLEKRLWRIEGEYFYEISEENRVIELNSIGLGVIFKLGEGQWLLLNFDDKRLTKVHYTKSLQNSEPIHYEKKIILDQFQVEISFEFTELDRINSS